MRKILCILTFAALLFTAQGGEAQTIKTVVGNGVKGYSGDGGIDTMAALNNPSNVVLDGSRNIYIADYSNNVIRKVSVSGVISTVAGNHTAGYSGDGGAATAAELNGPTSVAVDDSGNIYIADGFNNAIRKVNTSGIISTVATGFNYPTSIAVDNAGNIYVADANDAIIRKVSPSGAMSTVAGNGTPGYSGDGGSATSAELQVPTFITIDGNGNLYIADASSDVVRKVNTSGVISTVAGIPLKPGYSGDGGTAVSAELNYPSGVAVDALGNIYISDNYNTIIRKVNTSGVISTVAGVPLQTGYSGNGGLATAATIYMPQGVALDSQGNLYIVDNGNNRIREVNKN